MLFRSLGLICPSVIVIILVSKVLERFKESELVQKIFYGLRPASTALIAAAGLGVAKVALLRLNLWEKTGNLIALLNWKSVILAVIVYVAITKFKANPILCIACSAVAGIVVQM